MFYSIPYTQQTSNDNTSTPGIPETGINKKPLALQQIFHLTIIEMYTPRDLIAAARNECKILAAQKTLPVDALENQLGDLCREYMTYTKQEDTSNAPYWTLLDENDSTPAAHKFAETIYFIQGRKLLEQLQYNKLTRLQMEHECLARALLGPEQLPAFSEFGLRLLLWANQEQIGWSDSGYGTERDVLANSDSEMCSDEERDIDEDEPEEDAEPSSDIEDSDDEKAVYVDVWKPKLGRFVRFRY